LLKNIFRCSVIKKLFGKIGSNFTIESPFRCDYGYNIFAGEKFYANYNCVILDCARVTIGNNVFFGPNVSLFTAGHPIHFEPRNTGLEYAFPITIGNNVWIGGGAIINPGITIGDNVVIGSGSIVTKNIPSNSIAVGNPCKVIRNITDADRKYYYRNFEIRDNSRKFALLIT
jgi:acetyltransferase-like isoleucine patch superfamily enzyme